MDNDQFSLDPFVMTVQEQSFISESGFWALDLSLLVKSNNAFRGSNHNHQFRRFLRLLAFTPGVKVNLLTVAVYGQ